MLRTTVSTVLMFLPAAAFAHPGHPTLNPGHTHESFATDPLALLALAILAVGVALVASRYKRAHQRVRNKK